MKMKRGDVRYLGDGVYVKYDGKRLTLRVNEPVFNSIHLNFSVRQALRKLIDEIDVRDNHGDVNV